MDDLGRATAAADRMEGIVRQLLAFTGRQLVRVSRLDLNAVVQASAQLVTHALAPGTAWQTHLAWWCATDGVAPASAIRVHPC